MNAVGRALQGAVRSLVHPTILAIVLVPMLVAVGLWVAIAWMYWEAWTSTIQAFVVNQTAFTWVVDRDFARIAAWVAVGFVLAMLAPVVIVTALLIAAVFAMPVLVGHVARNDFPLLERRHGGSVAGSIWNALAAIFLFAVLWVVTLPLWLLGPLAVLLPPVLSAWLNQRLFRYDALADHADAVEMKRIFEIARGRLFLLGLSTGVLYFIPPINLIAPIYAALAFIHLCLDELQQLRAEERVIEVR
jgi:CysZ protein